MTPARHDRGPPSTRNRMSRAVHFSAGFSLDFGTLLDRIFDIAIAELFFLLRKHREESRYGVLLARLEAPGSGYRIEPITADDLRQLPDFADIPEMHDRLIAIQAARLGATVITKDKELQASTM